MHEKIITGAGKALGESDKVLIMLHGQGGSAESMLSLGSYLEVSDYTLIAPQANKATWFPFSFLEAPLVNEPWLSGAFSLLDDIIELAGAKGVPKNRLYFLGFSQGACLALEYAARNATRYGGVVAFTGGLMGDRIYSEHYQGNFGGTPVFIGTSNPDPHIPVERVHATVNVLRNMGAGVTGNFYNDRGHVVSMEEIELANRLVFNAPVTPAMARLAEGFLLQENIT